MFCFLCEGKTFEVTFNGGNFRHLCGVSSNISAYKFYLKALGAINPATNKKETLTVDDFKENTEKELKSALKKTDSLIEILTNIRRKSEIIINPKTETTKEIEKFLFALHGLEKVKPTSICFAHDDPKDKNPVPASVRTRERDKSFGKYGYDDIYEVDFILTKPTATRDNKFAETKYRTVLRSLPKVDLVQYLSECEIFDSSIDTEYFKEQRERKIKQDKERGIENSYVKYNKKEHIPRPNPGWYKEGEDQQEKKSENKKVIRDKGLTSTPFADLLNNPLLVKELKVKENKTKKRPMFKVQGYNTVGTAISGKDITEESLDKDGIQPVDD